MAHDAHPRSPPTLHAGAGDAPRAEEIGPPVPFKANHEDMQPDSPAFRPSYPTPEEGYNRAQAL